MNDIDNVANWAAYFFLITTLRFSAHYYQCIFEKIYLKNPNSIVINQKEFYKI